MKSTLLKPVSFTEVRNVVIFMIPNKAPDPDDFQPIFYRSFWNTTGNEVWKLVFDAFSSSYIPSNLANTLIVPIPRLIPQFCLRTSDPSVSTTSFSTILLKCWSTELDPAWILSLALFKAASSLTENQQIMPHKQ